MKYRSSEPKNEKEAHKYLDYAIGGVIYGINFI